MAARYSGSPIGKKHFRLKLADALGAHERALSFGGLEGIPNLSLVESALARPYSGYYPHLWEKAAALVESMAGNHGFADGNKRTTLILLHALIKNSGYRLVPIGTEDIEQAVEDVILAAAASNISMTELTEWFRPRLVKI
jgi:death-on-curing protein